MELNKSINQAREVFLSIGDSLHQEKRKSDGFLKKIAVDLLESGCVRFGNFQLKSGLESPIYIDLRLLVGMPDLLNRIADAYISKLRGLEFKRLAALPYAGLPITTAISLKSGIPMVYPRKETKDYGTQAEIEGIFSPGERVILIDDLSTTGGSKFEAIEKLNSVDLKVEDVLVLIDRESGAHEELAEAGFRLHAIFTLTQLLDIWKTGELISQNHVNDVQKFIATTSGGSKN